MIHQIKGDATLPMMGEGYKIIAHICNNVGRWGRGFVIPLGQRYPEAKRQYSDWVRIALANATPESLLGKIQVVPVAQDLSIVNMIAQHKIRDINNPTPIKYEALKSCLKQLATLARAKHASVHMPKIGSGLAGGNWSIIRAMINVELAGIMVYVYSL